MEQKPDNDKGKAPDRPHRHSYGTRSKDRKDAAPPSTDDRAKALTTTTTTTTTTTSAPPPAPAAPTIPLSTATSRSSPRPPPPTTAAAHPLPPSTPTPRATAAEVRKQAEDLLAAFRFTVRNFEPPGSPTSDIGVIRVLQWTSARLHDVGEPDAWWVIDRMVEMSERDGWDLRRLWGPLLEVIKRTGSQRQEDEVMAIMESFCRGLNCGRGQSQR